jgi:hypothetical protein
MLLIMGCGVGPDVGAASVHIRSQSIINGYGTGTMLPAGIIDGRHVCGCPAAPGG